MKRLRMDLSNSQCRVKLLKARFSGKEIEYRYILDNNIEIVGVNWYGETV